MARIEPLQMRELDADIRHMCEEAERQVGTSVSTRTYAKSPVVLKALAAARGALTLDPVLRELTRLKIAALNACRY